MLREAGTILVPEPDRAGSPRAEATVLAHLDPARRCRIRRVTFAMSETSGVTPRRAAAWEAAAEAVVAAFEAGQGPVVFATIGDPNVYSTFSYLARTVVARRPGTRVETVPGITAMQDLSSKAGVPLCEGSESLTLVPVTGGVAGFRAALRSADTVVAYKGGRRLPELLAVLSEEGRLADTVVGRELGLAGQLIVPADQLDTDRAAPYLTTILAAPRRPTTGGRL
jgi:precorrin-2/cobalt-factor-2 C20-methyltransferase